jgi:hypothetical protein
VTPFLIFFFLLILAITHSNDGREFGGSIYQRCSDRLETGVQLSWASGSNATKFGIGAKFDLDKEAAVRAKVNNASQIGLAYQQKLRDGEFLIASLSMHVLTLTLFSRHHFVVVNTHRWQELQCRWPQDWRCS